MKSEAKAMHAVVGRFFSLYYLFNFRRNIFSETHHSYIISTTINIIRPLLKIDSTCHV